MKIYSIYTATDLGILGLGWTLWPHGPKLINVFLSHEPKSIKY